MVTIYRYLSHGMSRLQGQKPFSFYRKLLLYIIIALNHLFIKLFSPTVINCTSLTVDPSGPLRMSSCDNHYGAECNFSCTIGYRLNGSSKFACVAPDNQHPGVWNNSIPTCEGKQLAAATCYKSIYPTRFSCAHTKPKHD